METESGIAGVDKGRLGAAYLKLPQFVGILHGPGYAVADVGSARE